MEYTFENILKGYNGTLPLIAVSRNRRVAACEFLVEEKNANVNLKDNDRKTALQHANDYPEIIEILKYRGAK